MTRFEGIVHNLERRYRETDSEWSRDKIEEYMSVRPCPECHGSRLRPESLAVKLGGLGIDQLTSMSARRTIEWFDELELTDTERAIARLILREIDERLRFLDNVGVGYLSLERAAATLSGGEAQRIRLATQIGSSLVGVLYILDEPSIGLHQRDNERLIATLERLRDLGNTVIVVEHDEGTMRAADHIVDMGPGAGEHGGAVVAEGTVGRDREGARVAHRPVPVGCAGDPGPAKRRRPAGYLEIEGAAQNNLQRVNAKIPLGTFCAVTGVSGSGKSTLVNEVLYKAVANRLHRAKQRPGAHKRISGLDQVDKIINIDQSPIGRTPRSNPATYIGVFDAIRDLFSRTQEARARGYKPGRFSFNVKGGRCEVCRGDGQIKIEMHFLPDVYVPCEQCDGKRYNRETLEVRFKGRTIADVLDMTVEEARRLLPAHPQDQAQDAGAARRRAGLRAPGPAGHHPLRRRGPAGQAGLRAVQGGHRPDALHPRRAHHRPALRRRAAAAGHAPAAGRLGQHRRGHRAQPRRDQDRRPDHRHGPRGRRGGRHDRGPRHAGAGGGEGRQVVHGPLPGRDRGAGSGSKRRPQVAAAA